SAPRPSVLSYDDSDSSQVESAGFRFHSLHATSQALHPIQIEVSVKKPLWSAPCGWAGWPADSTSPLTSFASLGVTVGGGIELTGVRAVVVAADRRFDREPGALLVLGHEIE